MKFTIFLCPYVKVYYKIKEYGKDIIEDFTFSSGFICWKYVVNRNVDEYTNSSWCNLRDWHGVDFWRNRISMEEFVMFN